MGDDRKNTYGALEADAQGAQALFETLFKIAPVPALLHDGRAIVLANDTCARFLGYETGDDLVGVEVAPLCHPEDRPAVVQRVMRMMKEGWVAPMAEERFLRKDGTWAYGNTVAAPIDVLGRRVIYVLAIDLADQRAAQQALRESEERFRTLFEFSADSKIIHDGEHIALANRTALRQFSVPEETDVTGLTWLGLVDPSSHEATKARVALMMSGVDEVEPLQLTMRCHDGTAWPGEVMSSAVTIDGRRMIQTTVRDLTERVRAEAELERYRLELERLVDERTRSLFRARAALHAVTAVASATVERRDPYTGGHQRRVALLAGEIARRAGMEEPEIEHLDVAARLHDIGKMCVPAEILSKPTRLSRIEYELVKEHAEAGYEILSSTEVSTAISEIVRQHHERLDGSGYPHGLRGDEMLPAARILAVADVVEAMVSHRPYRPAVGVAAALAEIADGRGTRYDAVVVDTCTEIMSGGFDFEEPAYARTAAE